MICFRLQCVKYHIWFCLSAILVSKSLFTPSWFSLTKTFKWSITRWVFYLKILSCTLSLSPFVRKIYFKFIEESTLFKNNDWCNPYLSICYGLYNKIFSINNLQPYTIVVLSILYILNVIFKLVNVIFDSRIVYG